MVIVGVVGTHGVAKAYNAWSENINCVFSSNDAIQLTKQYTIIEAQKWAEEQKWAQYLAQAALHSLLSKINFLKIKFSIQKYKYWKKYGLKNKKICSKNVWNT